MTRDGEHHPEPLDKCYMISIIAFYFKNLAQNKLLLSFIFLNMASLLVFHELGQLTFSFKTTVTYGVYLQ